MEKRSGNGVLRRRSRSGTLRESPENTRLRSRESRKDRDRERSGLSKRRRSERMMSESNRDGGDDTSDESVEEEEDEEEDERISVRMPPPNFSRTAKSPPIISVSVPRKARSAHAKRSHENWISGGTNNGGAGEQLNRHSSRSTSPSREIKAAAAPTSPSSSNASNRKKTKPRPSKIAKPPSSIQEIEIEVAEVLFGLTRRFQEPPNMPENNKDSNDSSKDAKSTQNSSISFFSAVAPKRKRPRPLKREEGRAKKNSDDEIPKLENPSPTSEKNSTSSPVRDGGETSVDLSSNPVPEQTAAVEDSVRASDTFTESVEKKPKIDLMIPPVKSSSADEVQNLRSDERIEQKGETVDAHKLVAPRPASKPERATPIPSPSVPLPMTLDGRSASLQTVRPNHCSTHCYIAKNIQYQQQLARMGPLFGPLYGPKVTNSSSILPAAVSNTISSSSKDPVPSQKKQPSQQAFLFSPGQPHPTGVVKSANPNLRSSSTESSDLNPLPLSFNYANLPNSEAQYLLLQNAGYPFQLPAYRGGPHPHTQSLPFFNGSVYLHPSQLQPHQKNSNPAGYMISPGESTHGQRQRTSAEDYLGGSHEPHHLQQYAKGATAAGVSAPPAFATSFAAAVSRPAGQRNPMFDDKKSTPAEGKASSRPEIDPNAEGSSRTLNLIPCSSMNGPRVPPPNQRQLQFHQQQQHLQLQQQQQLQLQQQLAVQKGKTSAPSDVNAGRLPSPVTAATTLHKYPGSPTQQPLQWKTSSSSSAVVMGRASPQLSFGGNRPGPPANQQSSQAPAPMLGQRYAGPLPPQLQKHQSLPPGQLFFSNPYYQRPPLDQHAAVPSSANGGSVRGLPPQSLLQAAQFAASSGAHTLMSAAGFPYLHAMPSVPVKPAEHKPAAGK